MFLRKRNLDNKTVVKTEAGYIIVRFMQKPSEETRQRMKNAGFEWHREKESWFAAYTRQRWKAAWEA